MSVGGATLCRAAAFGLLILGAMPPATAQGEAAPPQAAELAQRLSRALERLAAEERERAEQRQRDEEKLDGFLARRGELAGRLLEAELRRVALEAEEEGLQERLAQAQAAAAPLGAAARQVLDRGASLAEQAAFHLQEVPGGGEGTEAARRLGIALRAPAGSDTPAHIGELADLLARLDAAASQVRASATTLLGPRGTEEDAVLLAAGHLAFVSLFGSRRDPAVALAAPADAEGFRWVGAEKLSRREARAVGAAVEEAQAGAAVVWMPMDPTGRLRAEALPDVEGLAGRLRAGGVVMVPLALVALLALLLLGERAVVLYLRNGTGGALPRRILEATRAGRVEEAQALVRGGRGTVARVLAEVLARRGQGAAGMEDAAHERLLWEAPRLQWGLSGIAVLAAVAPLLGLLGTVTGIIRTFGVLQAAGGPSPGLMAGGISEALVTTATGLSIAIPVLLLQSVLRGRAERILGEAEAQAAAVLGVLAGGAGPGEGARA